MTRDLWVGIDFEFGEDADRRPVPCCAVLSGREAGTTDLVFHPNRLERSVGALRDILDKGRKEGAVLISFYVPAEAGALLALGIDPGRYRWIDVWAEWQIWNNRNPAGGGPGVRSLERVAEHLWIKRDGPSKEEGRRLVLDHDPADPWAAWGPRMPDIVHYCAEDAKMLHPMLSEIADRLLAAGGASSEPEWEGRALRRGDYMAALARMQDRGAPVDVEGLDFLQGEHGGMIARAQEEAAKARPDLFGKARRKGAPRPVRLKAVREAAERAEAGAVRMRDPGGWPRTAASSTHPTGLPKVDSDTISHMLALHGEAVDKDDGLLLSTYRDYKDRVQWLSFFKRAEGREHWRDRLGADGRIRAGFGPFGSTTMRNYPKAKTFLPANDRRIRSMLRIPRGEVLVGADYGRQEFAIAAELSGDPSMVEDYLTGDPYVALARRTGSWDGTPERRAVFKAAVLGLSYGTGPMGLRAFLAPRIGREVPPSEARDLYRAFWDAYPQYSRWREIVWENHRSSGRTTLKDGTILWGTGQREWGSNKLSVQNFPVQGTSGAILREAVALAEEDGLDLAFPLHDALYMWAPAGAWDGPRRRLESAMRRAWTEIMADDLGRARIQVPDIDVVVYGEASKDPAFVLVRAGRDRAPAFRPAYP